MIFQNSLINFDNFKRSWKVNTELPVSFSIKYSSDILDPKNHDLISYGDSSRRLIIIDKTVHKIYGKQLDSYFESLKVDLLLCVVDATEENKNWQNVEIILEFFEKNSLLRREAVIAIGGGVLLDIVGFCASIYRRGVPYIKVPTTLLAMVDASVGAKVAINHFERRNRLGSYYPAIVSLLDKKFIKSQNEREICNGLSEIFKLALIKDQELFDLLEKNYSQLIDEKFQYGAIPVRVINLAISGMIDELSPNLWEKRLDRCVDFGHSFSPLIEMKNLPHMKHGEAVVLDCLYSSCISHVRNMLSRDDLNRSFKTIKNLRIPTYHRDFTDLNLLESALSDTMKHRNNNQFLPLPTQIGNYKIVNDVSSQELKDAICLYEEMNCV